MLKVTSYKFCVTRKGFTLIELLVVIGILAILFAITLIAVNPSRQFSLANNIKRRSDALAILNAINQYSIDNRDQIPSSITTIPKEISTTGADLCTLLVPLYIAGLPVDPLTNNGNQIANCDFAYSTNYFVSLSVGNRIIVSAPATELSLPPISVMR